ncbi:MAG: NADP oxidoreductase, partial [Elusimicrobiota bacterium]
IAGKYVVGWAKRGPSGLVGTNRPCSVATVNALLEDFKGFSGGPASEKTREAAEALYRSRQKALFTFKDWKALDRIEVETGKKLGKVREKFTSVAEMAAALVSEKAAA